jgi:hypothetical protein
MGIPRCYSDPVEWAKAHGAVHGCSDLLHISTVDDSTCRLLFWLYAVAGGSRKEDGMPSYWWVSGKRHVA